MAGIEIEPIGTARFKWGEGPLWWKEALLLVDIKGGEIVQLDPKSGGETRWSMGEQVGTVVPCIHGGLLYAGENGISFFDPETGEKKSLADPEAEKRPQNRFNDGKCDPHGRFWAGTISTVKNEGDAALYCLDTDATLTRRIDHVTNSNGLCWTADGGTFYYIDTPTKRIDAFDFGEDGSLSNRRTVVDTSAKGYASSPDGMTIDAEGNLWVAFCHGGCVVCFNPATGKVLEQIDLPCLETTACAFGGDNLDRLFVTTGIHRCIEEPDGGRVFVIDGLGVQGVPAFAYQGRI